MENSSLIDFLKLEIKYARCEYESKIIISDIGDKDGNTSIAGR